MGEAVQKVMSENRLCWWAADECLNTNWFASSAEAKRLIEAWRRDYNESRPHMAHNGQSPSEFARNVGLGHGGKVKIAAGF